ncbi:MAG: hypothetical protein JSR54_12680 [Proteobacteria bacterium]|nr:hypothetical protein [Pseudomonadota bacterium]
MPSAATPTPAGQEYVAEFRRVAAGCLVVPTAAGARLCRQAGWRGFQAAVAPWARAQGVAAESVQLVSALPAPQAAPVAALGPRVLGVERHDARAATLTLEVPFELAIFAGHFPTVPIVPGAMLAGWAAALAAEHVGWTHGAQAARAFKFRRIVQPGPAYRLRLECAPDAAQLAFRYESAHGLHAEGAWLGGGA